MVLLPLSYFVVQSIISRSMVLNRIALLSSAYAVSILTAGVVTLIIGSQRRLERLVKERTGQLSKVNQALKMLEACNNVVLRTPIEQDLLNKVCKIIVAEGIFPIVWVGEVEDLSPLRIRPLQSAGTKKVYEIDVRESGSTIPEFRSFLAGKPWLVQGVQYTQFFKSKHEDASQKAVLFLPLMETDHPFGVLAINGLNAEVFTEEWITTLGDLANNLAVGLLRLRASRARRQAEMELEHEHHLLTRVMATSPAAIMVCDQDGKFTYANRQAEEMFNVDREEILTWNYLKAPWIIMDEQSNPVPPDGEILKSIENLEQPFHNFNYALRLSDGRLRWLLVSGAPIRETNGISQGFVLVIEDITERRQTEQALQRSEKQYRQLFEAVQEGIWMVDTDLRTTFVNDHAAHMIGYEVDDVIDRSVLDFFDPQWHDVLRKGIERRRKGKADTYDVVARNREGRNIYINMHSSPLMDERGKFIGSLALVYDVTKQRMREHMLETIVRMASSIRNVSSQQEMIRLILDQLIYLYEGQGAVLATREAHTGEIHFQAGCGDWEDPTIFQRGTLIEASHRVFTSGKPLVFGNATDDERLAAPDIFSELSQVVCLPLLTQDETIGALWLGKKATTKDQIPPSAEEVKMLMTASDIAASALHRTILHEETELRIRRLRALREINLGISGSMNIMVILNSLLKCLGDDIGMEAAAVLFTDPDTNNLTFVAGQGFDPMPPLGDSFSMEDDLAGKAVRTNQIVTASSQSDAITGFTRPWKNLLASYHYYECVPLTIKGHVKGVFEFFHTITPAADTEWIDFLANIASQLAVTLDNAELFEKVSVTNKELTKSYDATIEIWARAMEHRANETEGHADRVVDVAVRLAKAMGLSDDELIQIRRGALLHDIGIIVLPDSILSKPGSLTPLEWETMRMHPAMAQEFLGTIDFLRQAVDIAYCHHERWDGLGYPRGLKAEEIPLGARIFTVVDVWDALRSNRPYRPGWPEARVRAYLRQESGTRFDPDVVSIFLGKVLPELDADDTISTP
ncbi:MAG TPA: PAS domain S-box protein [Longilinea sp.]|nr:PAS domain S-box protein [Longilinea sp.]